MNCTQAKQIDLVDFMIKSGLNPKNIKGNQAWFLSPFRIEKTPSFKVDISKNIWYDFGEGFGGNIIDLVMKLHQCSTQESLAILSKNTFSFHQQIAIEEKLKYKIISIQKIENYNLVGYLKSRKINLQLAKNFCSEIHYTFGNYKPYYAISFRNNSNGYEIRNKFFKGCLGKKDITTFEKNSDSVSLFESWSDFLAYLTLTKGRIKESYIILNSTALVKKAVAELSKYNTINLFLDNDDSGNKATKFIENKYPNRVIDNRIYYKNNKDLNDYLLSR